MDEEIWFNEFLVIGMDFNVLKMVVVVYVICDGKFRVLDEFVNVWDILIIVRLINEWFVGYEIIVIFDVVG